MKYSKKINSFEKDEGVPPLNIKAGPGVQLLNSEGIPGVAILVFKEIFGPISKL